MTELERVLQREPVRLLDGRYSKGFVDPAALRALVDAGKAEIYEDARSGMRFVRATKPPPEAQS